MNKKSKKAAGILFSAAAIIVLVCFIKNKNKKETDDYDWIMW